MCGRERPRQEREQGGASYAKLNNSTDLIKCNRFFKTHKHNCENGDRILQLFLKRKFCSTHDSNRCEHKWALYIKTSGVTFTFSDDGPNNLHSKQMFIGSSGQCTWHESKGEEVTSHSTVLNRKPNKQRDVQTTIMCQPLHIYISTQQPQKRGSNKWSIFLSNVHIYMCWRKQLLSVMEHHWIKSVKQ